MTSGLHWQKFFSSWAMIFPLRMELINTMKSHMSMADYYTKMKNIFDNLRATEYKIYEEDLIMQLLEGLGREYETAAGTITAMIDSLSLQRVFEIFPFYESRLAQLIAGVTLDQSSGGRNYSQPTYQICGKCGHTALICYHRFDIGYNP
ncbi:hypothetical protein Pint_34882 [Pistacia integerrima]|uniref:Uncharacterized protein n=1 Tax=Pistacia integerrima TaxID=434235 RepID=A0ACC0Y3U3_9ROSI|nr:hypothetical protein Pint_34882 [Pistacia integerrima]